MWYAHLSELESYKIPVDYNVKDYFNRYKYWLKREYKYQKNKYE